MLYFYLPFYLLKKGQNPYFFLNARPVCGRVVQTG